MIQPDPSRKLKRGLKDISPLFRNAAEESNTNGTEVDFHNLECLSFFCPDKEIDSLAWSEAFMAEMREHQLSSFLLPLGSSALGAEPLLDTAFFQRTEQSRRKLLDWQEFGQIWQSNTPLEPKLFKRAPRYLILDFDYTRVPYFERVIPILDKWIVCLSASSKSVMETYKMMKAMTGLNRHVEYGCIFLGAAEDPKGAILYERLGQMLSKHLGVDLTWLGAMDARNKASCDATDFSWEMLTRKQEPRHLVKKSGIWSWVERHSETSYPGVAV